MSCRVSSNASTVATALEAGPAAPGWACRLREDLIELHGGTLEATLHDGEITFAIMLPTLEPTGS